jgi:hypothetical protein
MPAGMPLNLMGCWKRGRACKQRPFAAMIQVVICRKLFFPALASLAFVLFVSGCSFGDDNVGGISNPAGSAPASAPQVPESEKTNDFGNGPQPPPQGLD